MDKEIAISAFAALGQATRLDMFRLLVRHEPDGLPAGEIARQLSLPHNTASSHLAILERAELCRSERQGRSIVYRLNTPSVGQLVHYLTDDCCQGRPDLCAFPEVSDQAADRTCARKNHEQHR